MRSFGRVNMRTHKKEQKEKTEDLVLGFYRIIEKIIR